MNYDTEHLRLLAIFPLRRGRPGGAVLVVPAAVHHNRHDFRIRHAASCGCRTKTGRGVTARIPWLDFRRNRFVFVFTRDRDGNLYFDCRSMPFPPQILLVRPRHGVRRMSIHSFRNNSRHLYDYCALARARESVFCCSANVSLKSGGSTVGAMQRRVRAIGREGSRPGRRSRRCRRQPPVRT